MTLPSDDTTGAGDGRSDGPRALHGLSLELPERGTGARAARRAARAATTATTEAPPEADGPPVGPGGPAGAAASTQAPGRPSRRWLLTFAGALLVCIVAAAGLTVLGVSTLRDSRTGRTVTSATPDEPGFEGFLEPTPTLALTYVHDGLLEGVAVLSLGSDEAGGGVLLIPPDTEIGSGSAGTLAIAQAFGGAGPEQMRAVVENVAGVGIGELVQVDDARWAELVGPVAPLAIDNPDAVPGFPRGPIELEPGDVGPYLRARGRNESDLARLTRQEIFWDAWLERVTEAGPGAVPGELDTGLSRFVRGIAAGSHETLAMPVDEGTSDNGDTVFSVDAASRSALVVTLVPYPTGTSNAPRTLVRLLDGTGDRDHVGRVAPAVVASDASIVVVGNADSFDYETTQIRYHQPEQKRAAERIQRDLGAGEVIEDVRPIDSFDVTIVLGADL
ncbi:MAG TPA: LCP family protein [Acidimicrobiales bacterium]|nr:LCP family protein [Acidimicrobiales bacterium]